MSGRDGSLIISFMCLMVAVIAFAAPAVAGAKPPVVPDDSSIDQYIPTVPGAGGNQPFGGGGGGSHGGNGSQMSPAVSEQLQSSGPAGSAVATFTEQTGPPAQGGGGGNAANANSGEGDTGTAGDPVASVAGGDAGSGEGLGAWLPIILGLTALGALLFGLARHRGRLAGP